VERLVGVLSVAELLARSAISRVKLIGGADLTVEPDTLVDTRPEISEGGVGVPRRS
jgi:hypothetical protein